jgi:hypothetical protein
MSMHHDADACSATTRLFPRDGALGCHCVHAKSATDGIRARRRGPSGGRTTEGRNENMRLRALRRVCITAVGDVFRATQRGMRLLEIEMRIESRPSFEKRARRACERLWTEGGPRRVTSKVTSTATTTLAVLAGRL